jgi:hypothetical protein
MDLKAEYPGIHISLVMPGVVMTDFGKNALGGTPQLFSGPRLMIPQSAEEAGSVIISLIENPLPEVYTNPALSEVARRYYEDVAAFEENMGQSR